MKVAAQLTYAWKYDQDVGKIIKLQSISIMQDIPKGEYEIREHDVVSKNHGVITRTVVLASQVGKIA